MPKRAASRKPPASIVRETKIGSRILVCNSGTDFMETYVGDVVMVVSDFAEENGRWYARTMGGGYFSSWILVR